MCPRRSAVRSMAELARDYHDALQSNGLCIDAHIRHEAEDEVLRHIDSRAGDPDMSTLEMKVTAEDVERALREAKPGKAAGLNGIPTEFWTRLANIHREAKAAQAKGQVVRKSCDAIKILTLVSNDIEDFGVAESTGISDGWMCPIFKKKDPSNIANYRPITVLNSEYKIITKALTNKLARVAPHLIHRDQHGFVKGRKITDPINLVMELVEYSEDDLQNGVIVTLDQEKAY